MKIDIRCRLSRSRRDDTKRYVYAKSFYYNCEWFMHEMKKKRKKKHFPLNNSNKTDSYAILSRFYSITKLRLIWIVRYHDRIASFRRRCGICFA